MQEPRQNFVRCYLGKNSIGKTPTAIYDAIAYQRDFPKKKTIVFDSQDKFRKAHDERRFRIDLLIAPNNKEWAKQLQEHTIVKGIKQYKWAHSHLILDDYRLQGLLKGNDMPPDFQDLFYLRPQPEFNMDMTVICHEPRNILEGLKGYISHYHIFANEADATQYENKITCWLKCQQAALAINKYEALYKGHYDVIMKVPFFPHIIVEKEKPEPLQCINMDWIKAQPILEEFTKQAA